MGEKAPNAPTYTPTPYASPGSVTSAQTPRTVSGQQVAGQASSIMGQAPSWLNLNQYNGSSPGGLGGPFSQQLMNQTQNWYNQNVTQPTVAADLSSAQGSGQSYGSFAPAMAGQAQSEGNQQGFQAALAANQQQFNDVIQGNNAYYQGPAALASGQDNFQTGLQSATNMFNAGQTNDFNLASAGMANNFDLNNNQNPNAYNLANYSNQFQRNQYDNSLWQNALGMGLSFL